MDTCTVKVCRPLASQVTVLIISLFVALVVIGYSLKNKKKKQIHIFHTRKLGVER